MKINITIDAEPEEVGSIVSGFGSRKTIPPADVDLITKTLKDAGLNADQISGAINRFLDKQ